MNELLKKLQHARELWDKLDPRDRDVILRHSSFKTETANDWKALSKNERENLFRWFFL